MKTLAALKKHAGLTAVQKTFIKNKKMSGAYTPEKWLKTVQQVSEFDELNDDARKTAGWSAVGGYLFSYLSGYIFLFGLPRIVGALIGAVLLLFAIANTYFYFSLRRKDIPDNLRQFVEPMLTILSEDLKPGSKLELNIDFRGADIKSKILKTDKKSNRITDIYYQDPWFHGRARLYDGTSLQLQITDLVRSRYIRKPKKNKCKYKAKRMLSVNMGLPHSYPSTMEKTKAGDKRNTYRERAVLESRTTGLNNMNWVVDMNRFLNLIGGIYKQAEHQKQG